MINKDNTVGFTLSVSYDKSTIIPRLFGIVSLIFVWVVF